MQWLTKMDVLCLYQMFNKLTFLRSAGLEGFQDRKRREPLSVQRHPRATCCKHSLNGQIFKACNHQTSTQHSCFDDFSGFVSPIDTTSQEGKQKDEAGRFLTEPHGLLS